MVVDRARTRYLRAAFVREALVGAALVETASPSQSPPTAPQAPGGWVPIPAQPALALVAAAEARRRSVSANSRTTDPLKGGLKFVLQVGHEFGHKSFP
ncbi:MAG: hypothetical protein DWQ31_19300 [Planctomycetota bacterium]|nr:MAG: hypothetical protein DWQ31_19300 [Planctomycetota bacterium]